MSTVYKYRIHCVTDNVNEFVWNETAPTTCPTNTAHTIDTDSITIVDTRENTLVQLKEELDGVTNGTFKLKGYKTTIPAGTSGNVTSITHSWPRPITLMNGWFNGTIEQEGDCFDVTVADNTIIGAITAAVYTGNTTINVTSDVTDNLYSGYFVNITDGVNNDLLGEAIDINAVSGNITVETAAANNFSPASPTYVQMTVKIAEDLHINVGGVRYAFAEKKLGGKYIPKNTPLYIHYVNDSGNAKVFSYHLEYLQ